MMYINGCYAMSAQRDFTTLLNEEPQRYHSSTISAIPPDYAGYLDAGNARRLSKPVKNAWCCAVDAMKSAPNHPIAKIIAATAFGCLTDTISFLNKIKDFPEVVSPTPFIQSTHNTVAGFIGLQLKLHGLNKTISQRNFSVEHALIDCKINCAPNENVLLIGYDEVPPELSWIAESIDLIGYTGEDNLPLMTNKTNHTVIGEIYAGFVISKQKNAATRCAVKSVSTQILNGNIGQWIQQFLADNKLTPEDIDAVVMGTNGIEEYDRQYHTLAAALFPGSLWLGYKHLCGESFVASGYALYLAANILATQQIPSAMLLQGKPTKPIRHILLYNFFEDKHSLILLGEG